MKKISTLIILFFSIFILGCTIEDKGKSNFKNEFPPVKLNYLALGDSYTIGQSVCDTCRFPAQLSKELQKIFIKDSINTKIIAKTGWTTTNLITAIDSETLTNDYDLVTLLIGVNNQYQNRPFSIYENEFLILVNKAIELAKGNQSNLIVVSIPDYAFTPFGDGETRISIEIDKYNKYAENYCLKNNIAYINITDITREGLENPNLVATDGLHPSKLAYSKFVERILPKAASVLNK